ncbi:hypothetical protein Ocin01_02695 [Orchesella cincta]|uniref:Spaetzle domain-containing protein n=1 Tax=Orchesella cincta TaxID=48709 RepID=A0A1D2NFT9_ORCCI|nr:hypothetical protein Ocin01_02695 [Orchesella cincta]
MTVGVDDCGAPDTMEGSRSDGGCSKCGGGGRNGSDISDSDPFILRTRRGTKYRRRDEEVVDLDVKDGYSLVIPSSWTLLLASLVIIICSISAVSAIDLTPHGGFYHQRDEFSSSQSEYGGGGDDMIMTCSRPTKSSRAAKYLAIKQLDIPCDMVDKKAAWCNLPGDKYPWHAVRRFVFENQGLMRRMYGEVRQLSLLRMEFEDDLDDELEEERRMPPRAPPLTEDHRRNSILTEILDESLPRVLSQSPPGDQLLLRDHNNLMNGRGSTPRSFPAGAVENYKQRSSEELLRIMNNETTEVTIPSEQVTTDSVVLVASELLNGTTTTTVVDLGETGAPVTAGSVRSGVAEEVVVVTEEATQSTASGITEMENGTDEEQALLAAVGGGVVTTTEEITMSSLNENGDDEVVNQEPGSEQVGLNLNQQLNDGGMEIGGMGSDESHDFLNLDKNHILYFDDVGKNRRPVGGGSDQYAQPPRQEDMQQQAAQGKLKAVNACPVKEEVVAPYWANNTRGEILALLNLYPFEQYIHWERCNHENKQMFCRQGCRCEQQYRLHRLLAFDPTNECRGIFSDWFRFPSCCVCRCYLNEYELMMLNAAGQDNPPPSSAGSPKSRTSDRIRSPRKILLEQLVDGPDVHGVDDIHFFYKQGFNHEHNHGAQPRRKRQV